MNILYISKLSGNLFAGPNNSVPAQILAQSTIDNVFWYNLNNVKRDEWVSLECKNYNDYPSGRLKDLPEPFCAPDIVVFEEFYCFPFERIINDVIKAKIPYIIIPRSELTIQAQRKKRVKKFLGNVVFFKKFAKKAAAIQFLSEQESKDSKADWNDSKIIIPNGTKIQNYQKSIYCNNGINAAFIGRYETYQKGLDLLINAMGQIKDELRKAEFHLNMYGVDQEGTLDYLSQLIDANNVADLISINKAVFSEEKRNVLEKTDVFILTSRFEGMPMGLIEALSYGIPCLVTTGTNMAEEIKISSAGWTSEVSVEGIVHAFEKMLDEIKSIEIIGQNARDLSLKYSWDRIAHDSHDLFLAITERK